ncbi:MAG: (Fe-S)-binding protein [Desulfobacterales bacterium]|nr:(Fe-S)-binding protein [Desulfobacterales bacterium]
MCHPRERWCATIVTYCPECHHTIGRVYQERFGDLGFEVVHLSQLLEAALREGRLELSSSTERLTYQDPCRLGRGSGIYGGAEGAHRGHGRACGDGAQRRKLRLLRQHLLRPMRPRHQVMAAHQVGGGAVPTGAQRLVTACPKCLIHLSCAQKEMGTYVGRPRIEMVDLFSLAASRLKK